jgi:hypothetical protein
MVACEAPRNHDSGRSAAPFLNHEDDTLHVLAGVRASATHMTHALETQTPGTVA